MLAHAAQAPERLRYDARAPMVAVAGQVLDGDLGAGEGVLETCLELVLGNRHGQVITDVGPNRPQNA